MPLIDAKPDAVSVTYAKSLFELVRERGGRDLLQETLGELEDVMETARAIPAFSEFLSSRIINADRKAASLRAIFHGRIQQGTLAFLTVLTHNDRLRSLPGIVTAFDHLFQQTFGRIEVDVFTAAPLNDADKSALASRLQQRLGREPVVHTYVDATMLGGVRFQIGDWLLDASLSSQLRTLRERISANGLPQVRSGVDRIIEGQ